MTSVNHVRHAILICHIHSFESMCQIVLQLASLHCKLFRILPSYQCLHYVRVSVKPVAEDLVQPVQREYQNDKWEAPLIS